MLQVFNKATDKVAIFVHAMVWAFGTPFETGNFVPDGETPQNIPNLSKSDVSFMCEVSYGFDTSADKSIYTGLKTFEKLVTNDPRFNRHRLSRSTWQDGRETSSDVYIAVAKLFTKKGLEKPRKPVYDVHPWIERGLAQEGCEYVVNTLRPRLLACIGNATDKRFKIFTSQDQESFKQGDIVWFSFTVSFNVRKRAWTSEITPLELVRMGALTPMAIAEGEGGARPIPGLIDSDFTFLGEGENGDSEDVGSVPLELSGECNNSFLK
ncbi:hypothetical protein DFP72DRAFT_816970 [Ephemerocybe angulata]|uniref:Uncharacterized protein n=1 Tax=Ephemerocybe angulata TaxID=980116 RepID=A0A8H6M2V9_9AGAR|nr:hypothetical protein DFP72DRAFT_816970 [Tulosesus angulatus]